MKQYRCDKCSSQLLELWNKGKTSVWLACPSCDRVELNTMRQRKLNADVDKAMGIKS